MSDPAELYVIRPVDLDGNGDNEGLIFARRFGIMIIRECLGKEIEVTTHILFDFFGTLVNYSSSRTEQGYERSFKLLQSADCQLNYEDFLSLWSEVSAEFDVVAARTNQEFSMIDVGQAFMDRALETPTEEIASDFIRTYLQEWNKGIRYIEGLPEMLDRLGSKFTLSIITNTHDTTLVPDHLERMGVANYFSDVVTSVEFGIRKPAAEIFEHALRELHTEADQCVYVGDNYEADYVGARSAGIRGLLVDPSCQAPIPSADRLGSILELESVLDSFPTKTFG